MEKNSKPCSKIRLRVLKFIQRYDSSLTQRWMNRGLNK